MRLPKAGKFLKPPQWARNAGNPECNEGQKTIVAKPGEERYIREKGAVA